MSKVMIDVSRVKERVLLNRKYTHTIHKANTEVCGRNGEGANGQDYISAIFRVNHYMGRLQYYLERGNDYHGRNTKT